MTIRTALAALLLMTGMAVAAPAPEPTATEPGHLVSPVRDAKGAVTRQQFEARLESDAKNFLARHAGVRADRFAGFDIAWPRDAEESKRLGGNTVIVLGALSQDSSELPLSKAYLERADGSLVVLRRIGLVSRTLAPESQAAKAFGPNVTEEFYLVPTGALGKGVKLKCDFAKKRLGFVLSDSLAGLKNLPATQAREPLAAAVRAMVTREYPGFGAAIMGAK